MYILAHYKLKRADERSLHRRDIHLAVPLSGVPIAHFKQRSRRVYRNVQRRARHQILVVQISRVNPRRVAAEFSGSFWWRYAHAAEKWMQRNLDSWREFRHHPLFIQRNDFHLRIRIILRQESAARTKSVVSVRNRQPHRNDAYLQHIARLCILDINWPGKNVPARTLFLYLVVDV